jgi:hypothetical protein
LAFPSSDPVGQSSACGLLGGMTTSIDGRVLLLSSDDIPLDGVEQDLVDAGFTVHRCHEQGVEPFPCAGLVGGQCPLDIDGGMDVAVDVRDHPWPLPTRREAGVTCALRAAVPVVVVTHGRHPFEEWAACTVERDAPIADVVEYAIGVGLEDARAAAAEAVGAVFANNGAAEVPFSVRLERHLGRLQAVIAADVPRPIAAMAATRAAVAIRRFDRAATALEIEVVSPGVQR